MRGNEDMQNKLKEIKEFIEKHGSKGDLKAEEEIIEAILHMMHQVGINTLIILEKDKDICMMTTGISEEAFATIVAQAVIDFPHMSLIIIEKMDTIKAIQSQKDENNTTAPRNHNTLKIGLV